MAENIHGSAACRQCFRHQAGQEFEDVLVRQREQFCEQLRKVRATLR
jgi:hypothetical protein